MQFSGNDAEGIPADLEFSILFQKKEIRGFPLLVYHLKVMWTLIYSTILILLCNLEKITVLLPSRQNILEKKNEFFQKGGLSFIFHAVRTYTSIHYTLKGKFHMAFEL